MKRFFALILCACLSVGCSAASSSTASEQTPTPAPTEQALVETSTPEAAQSHSGMPLTGLAKGDTTARPVAVMVSNDTRAQVQWGLQGASVIIETLTEGYQTNLALLFDSLDTVPKVGPVSQAKDVFWQFAMAQNAILVQNDWNIYAENLLNCYNYQPVDAMVVGVNSFDIAKDLTAANDEFRWFTQGQSLAPSIANYGIVTQGDVHPMFTFGQPSGGTQGAQNLTIGYSSTASTSFSYRADLGAYVMHRADGSAQLDANTGEQVSVQNVIVLRAEPSIKDDKYTREYDLSTGTGLYLCGGTWQPITWSKGDVTAALQLFDTNGNAVQCAPGKTYISVFGQFAGQGLAITDESGAVLADASVFTK